MVMSEVTPDLVEEILCRVPATNLNQLRATCKGWNRLIKDDRRFRRKHFDKAAKKQYRPLVVRDLRVYSLSVNLHLHREVKIEKLGLIDPNSKKEFDMHRVRHCDGLLICSTCKGSDMVVWNPSTGETKWIRPNNNYFGICPQVYIGYCIDKDSGNKSYKLLCKEASSSIYDFDSDSWRNIKHVSPYWCFELNDWAISLKGNIYWITVTRGPEAYNCNYYLFRFDFSTEESQPLSLPLQSNRDKTLFLSLVRDDKLCLLLQFKDTPKTEIWVTNKIDDDDTTKAVSWTKLFALDLSDDLRLSYKVSFFLDEEKKLAIFSHRWKDGIDEKDMVYIVGEDHKVAQVELGLHVHNGIWQVIINYVPSLVQINPARSKRKIADLVQINPARSKRKIAD